MNIHTILIIIQAKNAAIELADASPIVSILLGFTKYLISTSSMYITVAIPIITIGSAKVFISFKLKSGSEL